MLAEADQLIGHNVIRFDNPAIKKVFPAWETRAVIRDTLLISRIVWPDLKEIDGARRKKKPDYLPGNLVGAHSLKAWGYRLNFHKDEYVGGWDKWSPEMHSYMCRDVLVTVRLWEIIEAKAVPERCFELEHKFAEIIFKQERHGFAFDVKAAHQLHGVLVKRRAEIEAELQTVFPPWWVGTEVTPSRDVNYSRPEWGTIERMGRGGKPLKAQPVKESYSVGSTYSKLERVVFNPGSRHHIADRLKALRGWKPNKFTPDGHPSIDEEVLAALPFPEAKLLAEYFTVDKRLGALSDGKNAWLRLERNGRIHGEVNTCGTASARCTHSKPNVSQVPSIRNANGPVPYGRECRALFIPSPGYVQVGGDAAGIQMRCLAHYMARWDEGAYGRELLTGDVHTANAKAAGLRDRENAKRVIYAMVLGGGDEMLGSIAEPNSNVRRQKALGKQIRAALMARIPALAALIEALKKRVDKDGCLKAIDGRRLPTRSAHSSLAFLLQSAEAIIVKQATVYLYEDLTARGWEFGVHWALLAHIHDELQSEVLADLVAEYCAAFEAAMIRAGEAFNFRIPLKGETKHGKSWADCH